MNPIYRDQHSGFRSGLNGNRCRSLEDRQIEDVQSAATGSTLLKKILVVEDEALIALDIEQQLTDAGFDVILAANGPAALGLAKTFKVQLAAAVVNLRLPEGLVGQDVIRRLRREMPDLPVVVATGFAGSAPEANLRGMGGPTVRLQKPLERTALVQCLQQVLRTQHDRGKISTATGPRRRARDR